MLLQGKHNDDFILNGFYAFIFDRIHILIIAERKRRKKCFSCQTDSSLKNEARLGLFRI